MFKPALVKLGPLAIVKPVLFSDVPVPNFNEPAVLKSTLFANAIVKPSTPAEVVIFALEPLTFKVSSNFLVVVPVVPANVIPFANTPLIASSTVFAPEIPPISVASINPVCGFTAVLVPKIFAILFCEAFN